MNEQEKTASSLSELLAGLTVSRVALGLALAAGAAIIYRHYATGDDVSQIVLLGISVGMLSVAIVSTMWGKMELAQLAVVDQWRSTVNELRSTVEKLELQINVMQTSLQEALDDRDVVQKELMACLGRDRAMHERLRVMDEKIDKNTGDSNFGALK